MNFREATDDLCDAVSHEELAKALGVSVATVRQARLRSDAKAHRAPPGDWKRAVTSLAKQRVEHYRVLLERLSAEHESVDAASTHHV
jgi:hypothetical protein